jgi:hypothetical protein
VFLRLIWRNKNTGGKTAGATENIGAQLARCILLLAGEGAYPTGSRLQVPHTLIAHPAGSGIESRIWNLSPESWRW